MKFSGKMGLIPWYSIISKLWIIYKNLKKAFILNDKLLKIALAVLNAVRSTFSETNEFIDSTLKEECEREKTTAD